MSGGAFHPSKVAYSFFGAASSPQLLSVFYCFSTQLTMDRFTIDENENESESESGGWAPSLRATKV